MKINQSFFLNINFLTMNIFNYNLYFANKQHALSFSKNPFFKSLLLIFILSVIAAPAVYAQQCAELDNPGNLSVEPGNSELQINNNGVSQVPANNGLSPTEGAQIIHFSSSGGSGGSLFLPLGTVTRPGIYEVIFDVGSFTNNGLAAYSGGIYQGGTSNASPGTIVPDITSTEPQPAQGVWETGSYKFTVSAGSTTIGQSIAAFLSVPDIGKNRNIGFDNFRIIRR